MLDQLVESKSHATEDTKRSGFLLTTFILMVTILMSAWLYSLFAKDYGMGGDELSLETLVAPPVIEEAPEPEPVITPDTFTACPESCVGLNRAPRAAATAAARSSGCPLTALAETTLPLSSIKTWTVTAPLARTALAAGGYGGFGRLVALPFNTPPEICFGTFFTGGGGGGAPPVSSVPPPPVAPLSLPVPPVLTGPR